MVFQKSLIILKSEERFSIQVNINFLVKRDMIKLYLSGGLIILEGTVLFCSRLTGKGIEQISKYADTPDNTLGYIVMKM